jgi:hypothetical protein
MIEYAINNFKEYINISDVNSGKTNLKCPFCGGLLIAKKGISQAHHFAHQLEGCSHSTFDKIPTIDGIFHLGLTRTQETAIDLLLKNFGDKEFSWEDEKFDKANPHYLLFRANIKKTKHVINSLFEKNALVKISEAPIKDKTRSIREMFTKFSLSAYSNLLTAQLSAKSLAVKKLLSIEDYFEFYLNEVNRNILECTSSLEEIDRIQLDILNADLERSKVNKLYFLKIIYPNGVFYKIGITTRTIQERLKEIEYFVRDHFPDLQIKPLYFLDQLGFLERYFKVKYFANRLTIGQATEYFLFSDSEAANIIEQFERLKEKKIDLDRYTQVIVKTSPPEANGSSYSNQLARISTGVGKKANRPRSFGSGSLRSLGSRKRFSVSTFNNESCHEKIMQHYGTYEELVQSLLNRSLENSCSTNEMKLIKEILYNFHGKKFSSLYLDAVKPALIEKKPAPVEGGGNLYESVSKYMEQYIV